MSQALSIVSDTSTLPAALGPDLAAAIDLAKAEKAASTRKAYGIDYRLFKAWCDAKGVSSLPAAPETETVAAYIAAEAQTAKPSTIGRRLAAIRYAHKLAGLETPTDAEGVKATMRGIRRTFGGARIKKTPAVAAKMLGDPWRISSRPMQNALGSTPARFQATRCGPVFLPLRPARARQSSR